MSAPPAVAAAWSAELGRLAALVAHELNNLLNGVAVNLEVVRSRAARGAGGADIASFAATAAEQFDAATPVARALVALARPAQEPAGLGRELGHLGTLLGPVARARGGRLRLAVSVADASTCVSGATARLLLASAVRGAVEAGGEICCELATGSQSVVVRVARTGAGGVNLPQDITDIARECGIRIERLPDALQLGFPVAPAPSSSATHDATQDPSR